MRRFWVAILLSATSSTASADQTFFTLKRIHEEGVLRWACDSSGGAPFAFNDPARPDHVVGFEIDLMEALARHLGVRAVREQIDWAAIPDSVRSGRVDLGLNGFEVTPEREEQLLFTTPYFRFAQQLTVRKADARRYTNLESLRGHVVSALNASASVDVLRERGWTPDLIREEDDSLKPFMALKQGRADASLCESIIAAYYAEGDPELHVIEPTFSHGTYAGIVRNTDPDLKYALDEAINELKRNGELGEIYQRWGLWTDDQTSLGTTRGRTQTLSPLARRQDASGSRNWSGITLSLLEGAGWTLALTALSMPLALAFGLLLALMSMSSRSVLRWPARAYIQVIRGTPLLVQIFVIFFSLPALGQALGFAEALTWPAFFVGVLCLSANYAAYEAEIHRAGIEAVPKGQTHAALALGMSPRQAFVHVVLPQSFRIILPPVVNDLVSMLKDSCLVSVMGVGELLFVASAIGKSTFLYGEMLLLAAALYLVLSLAADRFGRTLEARLRQRGLTPVASTGESH